MLAPDASARRRLVPWTWPIWLPSKLSFVHHSLLHSSRALFDSSHCVLASIPSCAQQGYEPNLNTHTPHSLTSRHPLLTSQLPSAVRSRQRRAQPTTRPVHRLSDERHDDCHCHDGRGAAGRGRRGCRGSRGAAAAAAGCNGAGAAATGSAARTVSRRAAALWCGQPAATRCGG